MCSFEWARRRYFLRGAGDTKFRGGLVFFGPLFVLANSWYIVSSLQFMHPGLQLLASAALLMSLALFFLSLRAHRTRRPGIAFSLAVPAQLTFGGPYRWVRHPIYLSYIIFWLGCAIVAPVTGSIALIVMSVIYYKAASAEERSIMLSSLAGQYGEYRLTSGMFFPKSRRGFRES